MAVLKLGVSRDVIVETLGILFMLKEQARLAGRPLCAVILGRWLGKMKEKGYRIEPKLYEWAIAEFKRRRK